MVRVVSASMLALSLLIVVGVASVQVTNCSTYSTHASCVANLRCMWCGNSSLLPPHAMCYDPSVQSCCATNQSKPPTGCEPEVSLCSATDPHCSRYDWDKGTGYSCQHTKCCPADAPRVCGEECVPETSTCCLNDMYVTSCAANSSCCGMTCCDTLQGQWCNPHSLTCQKAPSSCALIPTSKMCLGTEGCGWCGRTDYQQPLSFCYELNSSLSSCCALSDVKMECYPGPYGCCPAAQMCTSSNPVCATGAVYTDDDCPIPLCCPTDLPVACGDKCYAKGTLCCEGSTCQEPATCCGGGMFNSCCPPNASQCCISADGMSSWCCPASQVCVIDEGLCCDANDMCGVMCDDPSVDQCCKNQIMCTLQQTCCGDNCCNQGDMCCKLDNQEWCCDKNQTCGSSAGSCGN